MEENKQVKVIDLTDIFKRIWKGKKLFYKTLSIAFVLSCFYILSFPRYYTTEVKLAPEVENASATGTLGSIASSFGIDLSNMQSSDAITPLLYPDLMEDNGFVTELFNIHVKSQDNTINTTFYDYLARYQKGPWWSVVKSWIIQLFKKEEGTGKKRELDPYNLTKKENDIAQAVRNSVLLNVNKKTGIISIAVTAQDPLICKTVADSVTLHLQDFITKYRTSKARNDYEYYKKLAEEAKNNYETVRKRYGSMSDANSKVALKSVELLLEDMENDMQLKFNAYTTVNTQLQAAKAKVQEKTPAFTVLKGASVPLKPAGPKRMIFVAVVLFFTFLGTATYLYCKSVK